MSDLIEITEQDGVLVNLIYASADNLVGRAVYAPGARSALRPEAANCLYKAIAAAKRCSLKLVIYDAYRPAAIQKIFWQTLPDPRYIADANLGSNHTRGVAVDVGLIDANGKTLDMGTGFDEMCDQSHHDRDDLPVEIQQNRHLLLGIMLQSGFTSIPTEWWHYELPNSIQYDLIPESDFVHVIH